MAKNSLHEQKIADQLSAIKAFLSRSRVAVASGSASTVGHSEWGPPHPCRDCGAEIAWHTGRRRHIESDGRLHICTGSEKLKRARTRSSRKHLAPMPTHPRQARWPAQRQSDERPGPRTVEL